MFFAFPPEDVEGFPFSKLKLDEAFLNASSETNHGESFLYGMDKNCHGCPLKRILRLSGGKYRVEVLSSQYPWDFRFRSDGSDLYVSRNTNDPFQICEIKDVVLGEYGVYNLVLQDASIENCSTIEEIIHPVHSVLPLYAYMVLCLAALTLYCLAIHYLPLILHKLKIFNAEGTPNSASNGRRNRVHSLDVFRGITIALMIFVNDGGGHYYFMEHATWNGFYVADLAFPWFMWIMGFCIPMSLVKLQKRRGHLLSTLKEITRRSCVLFALGLFWSNNGWIDLSKTRIPGVLQRFAVCYFLVGFTLAPLFRLMKPQGNRSIIKDIVNMWPRWIVLCLLIIIHTLITFLLPVPGCPTGYLGPGGLHLFNITSADCIGGASGYLDKLIFTSSHIYSNPTAKHVYASEAFDPEGLLGSLTSAATVFLGAQGGFSLLAFEGKDKQGLLLRFLAWGGVLTLIGGGLTGFSMESGPIPLNKNLWSLSYVFVTSGLAYIFISFLYFIVDFRSLWNGAPFLYAGMNSILLYLGHSLAWQMPPFHFIIGSMSTHFAKLSEALWGVSLWLLIAYILHRKKIYITV